MTSLHQLSTPCDSPPAQLYYDKIIDYIQKLLELTLNAITTQSDTVARQAIAFWSAVCDTEYELLSSEDEQDCKKFIMGATPYLIPVLLKTMTCQVPVKALRSLTCKSGLSKDLLCSM